jgi:NAD(P)-dependent dehydrogenase (short-subunit alcohol dehydrogenase family)
LKGKTCIITGANSGIGKATALGVARSGANVVLACRDLERGEAARGEIRAASGNSDVELILVDLSALESVRNMVEEFRKSHRSLHVLINNAAVFKRSRTTTPEGLETMFATNHLGPFLLTSLLLDLLKESSPSRILNITAPSTVRLDFGDLQGEKKFSSLRAFGASKACNLLFTYELSRRLQGTGVTVNAIHPGLVKSNLMRESWAPLRWAIRLASKGPDRAAETMIHYASSSDVEGVTGKFFKGREAIDSSEYTQDHSVQKQLWDVSVGLAKGRVEPV